MNGILYFRLKQHRTRQSIADRTGFCVTTIRDMEQESEHNRPCRYYMSLAEVFGVTVEALISDYSETLLLPGDRYVREDASCHPGNVLGNFKREQHLNFDQMAVLLGLAGRECARIACRTPNANPEYVSKLAKLQGITPKEFERRYRGGDAA